MTRKAEKSFLERSWQRSATYFDTMRPSLEESTRELEAITREPATSALGRRFIAGAFTHHCRWLEAQGTQKVYGGDPSGWDDLREAQSFVHWRTRIQEVAYQRDRAPDRWRRDFGIETFSGALLALHLDAPDAASALVTQAVTASRDDSEKKWLMLTSGALAFQLRLYEGLTNQTLDFDFSKVPELGRYEELLDDALSGEAYAKAVEWACDEHIFQTRETKQAFPPFLYGVAVTLPIELVSWRKLRRQRGLDHGTDGHPLLDSPLGVLDVPPLARPPSAMLQLLHAGEPHMQAFLDGPGGPDEPAQKPGFFSRILSALR